MSERDPRIDPQAGDVLRKGSVRREVTYRESGGMAGKTQVADCVQCIDRGGVNPEREVRPTLKQFRKWAKTAHVEERVLSKEEVRTLAASHVGRGEQERNTARETERIKKTAEIQKLFRYCRITSRYDDGGKLLFRLEWDGLTESEVRSLAKEEYIPRGTGVPS